MTYKIINTLTGDVTPCSALSMSRKLQPNTTLAEYGARGVLLNSYPISGVDLQCLSVHFGAAADADAYTYSVRRAADAAATAADAALAAAPDALATALAAAADAAYVHYSAVHAVYVKTHVSGEDAAYVLYSAALDALRLANAHYAHYIKGVTRRSKGAEYTRQGRFILDYLRAA